MFRRDVLVCSAATMAALLFVLLPGASTQLQIISMVTGQEFPNPNSITVSSASDLSLVVRCKSQSSASTSWSTDGNEVIGLLQTFGVSQEDGVLRIYPTKTQLDLGQNTFQCSDGVDTLTVQFNLIGHLFFTEPVPMQASRTQDITSLCKVPDIPKANVTAVADSGFSYCVVETERGTFRSRSILIEQEPSFSSEPKDITVSPLNGISTAAFSCTVDTSILLPTLMSIQWYFDMMGSGPTNQLLMEGNGVSIFSGIDTVSDSRTSILVLSDVGDVQEGVYRCVATFQDSQEIVSRDSSLVYNNMTSTEESIVLAPPSAITLLQGATLLIPCVSSGLTLPLFSVVPVGSAQSMAISDGITASGLNMVGVAVGDSGEYTCSVGGVPTTTTVTVINGLSTPESAVMFRDSSLYASPPEHIVRENNIVRFVCIAPATGVRIEDLKNGIVTGDRTAGTTITSQFRRSDSGFYQCGASRADLDLKNLYTDESTSIYVLVAFLRDPIISPTYMEIEHSNGASISLNCTAEGNPIPRLSWTANTSPASGSVQAATGFMEPSFSSLSISLADLNLGPNSISCTTFQELVPVASSVSTVTVTVLARPPPPQVSLITTQPAYHGTSHNLTCMIVVDSSVDTPFTLDVVWSYEETQLQSSGDFNILPTVQSGIDYKSILTISPLNQPDMSSGNYLCEITIQPTINTYISQGSGSANLTLEVLAAPAPVLTTDVPERPVACQEASGFTCSASVVDNFVASPVITWLGPDNQVVCNQGNLDVQNGGIRVSAGNYTCLACVTVSSVSIVDLCSSTSITIAYSEPGPVETLSCSADLSSADTLKVSWTPPKESFVVVGYQVEVRQYVSSEEREVSLVKLDLPFNKEILSMDTSESGLAPYVCYNISVMAVSAGGCGSVNTVECYVMEGVPSQVQGLEVDRLSSSRMNVSWTPLTIVEARGFLQSYIVTYFRMGEARHKRQMGTQNEVSANQSNIVIDGLEAGVDYDVTVSAQTSSGMISPASPVVRAGTLEFVLFQLRLTNINNCPEWVTVEQDSRISAVSETLITEVESRCHCGFTTANLVDKSFQCFPSSENAVTYRAKLGHTNPSNIIDTISQWIAEDGITRVQQVLIRVDTSCQVSISSFGDAECTSQPAAVGGVTAIVGGVTGSIIVVLIIIIVMVIVIVVFRSRQAKLTLDNTDNKKNQLQSATLHETTLSNPIEPYEMMEVGHEYEVVSDYQKQTGTAYENISHAHAPINTQHSYPPSLPQLSLNISSPSISTSLPAPNSQPEGQSSHEDDELTKCIAYQSTSNITSTDIEIVYSN